MSAPRGLLLLRNPDHWDIDFTPAGDPGIPDIDLLMPSDWRPFTRFLSELPPGAGAAIDSLPGFEGVVVLVFFFAKWKGLVVVRASGVVFDLRGGSRGANFSVGGLPEPLPRVWDQLGRSTEGGEA